MSKNNNSGFDSFQLISPVILILYLSIGFVPNWEAVDKIAPQWLVMALLNFCSLLLFFFNRNSLSKRITSSLVSGISLTYICFILWASLSYFYAINPTEVLVNITRQFNVLFMFLTMGILLFSLKNKLNLIPWIVTVILGIEVYAVLNDALEMLNTTGYISPGELKGVTANRNITAFSIAIKIPFVLFLIYRTKKLSYKLIASSLIFLALFSLSMIESRASFIGVLVIIISFCVQNFYLYFKENLKLKSLFNIGYLLGPLLFAIILNQIYVADKGADAISRAATISFSTNDGSVNQRLRYYEDVLVHLKKNDMSSRKEIKN